jgi:hypothetical protein
MPDTTAGNALADARGRALSDPMRDLLWVVAQHKYGWAGCPNVGRRIRRFQTAEALERRGLVAIDRTYMHYPTCSATDAGRAEIERRWPVSPFALGTYAHQPGGWTPVEGVAT